MPSSDDEPPEAEPEEAEPEEAEPLEGEPLEGQPVAEPPKPAFTNPGGRTRRVHRVNFGAGRAGILQEYSLPEILVAAEQGRETGELTLHHTAAIKTIFLKRGHPAGAMSTVPEERFPAFARASGLDPVRVADIAARAEASGRRTGEAMVAEGLVTAEERRKLVEVQSSQIIRAAFAWEEGVYEYRPLPQLPAWLLPVSLRTVDLILEGARSDVPLTQLRERLSPALILAPAPDPSVELHQVALEPDEAMVLIAADGTRTVAQLVASSKLDERRTLAVLYAARTLNLLAEVDHVRAAAARAGF